MYIPRIPHYIRDDTGDKSVMARRQESDEAISLITPTPTPVPNPAPVLAAFPSPPSNSQSHLSPPG